MFQAKPVTAIVPARGGSKGVPGKNLLKLGGESLVARAARFAMEHPAVDRTIVTSDDGDILDSARTVAGVETSRRPDHLASDSARSSDVVLHLMEECGIADGWLLLLQPTSPLRSTEDLDDLLETVSNNPGAPAAVSVVSHDEPRPEKLQRINRGCLAPYLGSKGFEGPRQELPQPYALNGAFYFIRTDVFAQTGSFMPEGTLASIMPASRSANIDTIEDWQVLNAMISAGHWQLPE